MFGNKKKKYFKYKLEGTQKMIWDNEFKKEKTLTIREEVRREYDGTRAKHNIISSRIKAQLKDPNKICEIHNPEKGKEKVHRSKGKCTCVYIEKHVPIDEIEKLYDEKEILELDQARYVEQMKKMDLDVHGSKKTNEFPEGYDGIDQTLDALRELKVLLADYIKKI